MTGYVRSGPAWFDEGMASADVPKALAADEYYYDEGVFYLKGSGGYTVVAAPVGGVVKTIPSGYETVVLDDAGGAKNYYWGGTFYEKVSNGYKVVAPTAGAVVEHMAEGGEEVKMGDVTYVKLGETYYQPIQQNGKSMYEVVNVEKAK
jgi:biotin carboxyl carrier protein